MSNIVTKTLELKYGSTSSKFTTSGLYTDYTGFNRRPITLWGNKYGTATMNNTGKSFLYPKAGVHPFKADIKMIVNSTVDDPHLMITIDDNFIFNEYYEKNQDITTNYSNLTLPAIINSTMNSTITFSMEASSTSLLGGFSIEDNSYLIFYYYQWDLTAEAIGDGFRFVNAPGRIYNGENVTYSVGLKEDAIWQGWYADINHTQLVSTDLNYTITATQDLKLYAYALYSNNYDDIYLKSPLTGTWIIPSKFYIKTINGWEFKSDPSTILSTNDKFQWPVMVAYGKLSIISTLNIDLSAVPYKRDFLLIDNDMQGYNLTNYTCTHPNKISVIDYSSINATIVAATSVSLGSATCKVTLTYENYDYTSSKTVTLNITEKIETKTIYFKDQNGNNFTETINQNVAYTVTTPTGYTNFIGWKEFYGNEPTGRILQIGQSYYDVGQNKMVHYEPVFSE